MKRVTLSDLQISVQDPAAFDTLGDYLLIGQAYLNFIRRTRPTRIVSPSHSNYIFFQYDETTGHKITRPLNIDLFIESRVTFRLLLKGLSHF